MQRGTWALWAHSERGSARQGSAETDQFKSKIAKLVASESLSAYWPAAAATPAGIVALACHSSLTPPTADTGVSSCSHSPSTQLSTSRKKQP